MIDDNWQAYEVNPEVSETPIGGETVLLHMISGQYFGLDPQSTLIWSYIKSGNSLNEVIRMLTVEQGVDQATAAADLQEFFAKLLDNDILIPRDKAE